MTTGSELAVLSFELAQAAQLGHTYTAIQLLPTIERLFADAVLTAYVNRGGAGLDLTQDVGNLFLAELALLHRFFSFGLCPVLSKKLTFQTRYFSGRRSAQRQKMHGEDSQGAPCIKPLQSM
jgi:hypothetical protein